MPDINSGSVHIDTFLTNFSVAIVNDSYSADFVSPMAPVDKRSDKYPIYNKEFALRDSGIDANGRALSLVRPGGVATETDYPLSTDSYYCEEYRKRQLVRAADRAIADSPLQPDLDATMNVTSKLRLDNEGMVAAKACKTTNYGTSHKALLVTSTTSWAAYAASATTSNPFLDIKNGKLAIAHDMVKEANSMLLTVDSARTLSNHPLIIDRVKYTHMDALTGNGTPSGLPPVLQGLKIQEATTQKLTSAEGVTTQTTGNVWQNENGLNVALIFYRSMDLGLRSVHFMRSFDSGDDLSRAKDISIRKYIDEPRKGEWVEAQMTRDYKFVSVDGSSKSLGGYLISGTDL